MKKIAFILLAAAFLACSDTSQKVEDDYTYTRRAPEESNPEMTAQESPPATIEVAESSDSNPVVTESKNTDGVVKVAIAGTDQMRYNKKEITVPVGSTVVLTLKHTGTMTAKVMGHNFVLLKKGTNVTSFATEAMKNADNDYIPPETDKVIAHTELIGGGESTTIKFEAPAPGTYTFICTFPGHYAMMKGEFIVK